MTALAVPWRGPMDWRQLSAFFQARAIPGVEWLADGIYRRGAVEVRRDPRRRRFEISAPAGSDAPSLAARVGRMFDTDADVGAVERVLGRDRMLAPLLRRHRGIRIPGGWDPFEVAVRAIVGQQVSVAAARTLLQRLAEQCGERHAAGCHFPTPERVAGAQLSGLPGRRLESLRSLARGVADGSVVLERSSSLERSIEWLCHLPGIGPWSAHYIAMRAFGERDAFPAGDLILRRNAGNLSEKELTARAERWRPFRAYAAILIWAG